MSKIVQTVTLIQIVLSLISGLVGAIAGAYIGAYVSSIPAYQQLDVQKQQIDIMRKSLERKANLVMTVLPSSDFAMEMQRNGTLEIKNASLTLSRTENFTFSIYVCNVGDAFAHLLYYIVSANLDPDTIRAHTSTSYYSVETIVLKPGESTSVEYRFDPSISSTSNQFCDLTFVVGSAETSVAQILHAHF